MPRATVLIPTHDHGRTLEYALRSALGQTVADVEVFVVGDGVPDVTRQVVAAFTAKDPRVRFWDNPKGPRHGEIHRHKALAEARGDIVCYLSDDDLWAPDHVATVLALLGGADFAHALPVCVFDDGALGAWAVDLALPYYRDLLLSGENRVPLSFSAHTLKIYRSLPEGWRTTPPGIATDLYMYQQIFALPHCRARSGTRPTVLNFPSPPRRAWTTEQRLGELDRWAGCLARPGGRSGIERAVLELAVRHRAVLDAALATAQREVARLKDEVGRVRGVSPP